ncbi:hypothetical protein UPYG_G00243030 [Umbra pygmaea]|uniref:Butyrophilin subfamily 1 member A1-like n=1 Tax=Umbra pygmaea TaxID=75934 RepID=A0ABD0WFQ7_UMBPY
MSCLGCPEERKVDDLHSVMWLYILASLCVSLPNGAAEIFAVSGPDSISVRLRGTASIPCWLTPSMNAEGLEVRWYRPKMFDNPVLLYRENQIQVASQLAQYENRTSLGLREAKSEGLKGGDVTLKLVNVTLTDEGPYVCYVSSDQGYETVTVKLNVNVLGSPPLMSAVRTKGGSVNVSCVSHGWKPRPALLLSNGRQTLQPGGQLYSSDAQGLVSVQSWILSSPSSAPWVSCSLGLPEGDRWEGRVDLHNLATDDSSDQFQTAVIILALLLLIAAVVIGVLLYRMRGKKSNYSFKEGVNNEEAHPLLSTDKVDIETMRQVGVDVTLDSKAAPANLRVTPNGKVLRDNIDHTCPPDEHSYMLGTRGFTSGCRAYWEVKLWSTNVKNNVNDVKESWWVGVVSSSVKGQGPATSSTGFWFLSSDKEKVLRLNTSPNILLPAIPRPKTLGVYLDYDKGELSFINVEDNKYIVTMETVFTGEVFPLFNPGRGDTAPMTILNIPKTDAVEVPVSKPEASNSTTETPLEQSEMETLLPDNNHSKVEN